MNIRHYLADEQSGNKAVQHIIELVATGLVEPLIGLDVETMPIAGLEGYPHKVENEDGKYKWPTKVAQRQYWLSLTERLFNIEALRSFGIYPPTKTQTKKQIKAGEPEVFNTATSKNGNIAWKHLRESVEAQVSSTAGFQAMLACMKTPNHKLCRLWAHFIQVCEDGKRIAVDPVEPGLDPYTTDIFVVQMTLRDHQGGLQSFIFNVARVDIGIIKPLLTLPVKWLGANIKFDIKHLLHNLGVAPENVFDTQVGSRMLYLGLKKVKHSLAHCAKRYAGVELDKTVRETFIGVRNTDLTEAQLEYAYQDTEVLFPIYDRIQEIAAERGQVSLIDTFSRLTYVTARWELEGYLIDQDKWREIAAQVVAKRDEYAAELEKMLLPPGYADLFGNSSDSEEIDENDDEIDDLDDEESEKGVDGRKNAIIRISQTALVTERLREVLQMPIEKGIGKDARNVLDADYRAKNKGLPHPFFELYGRWAKVTKQASTYGLKFLWAIHPLTGKVHPTFRIAGTDTGRYSCVKPNMLNIPTIKTEDDVDFRAAFLAPEGYVFLNADYNGMEQRIAGDLSGDPVLLKIYETNKDSHNVTASMMFHIIQDETNREFEPYEEECDFQYGIETLRIRRVVFPKSYTFEQMFELATSEWVEGLIVRKKTRDRAKTVGFLWYFGGIAWTLATKTNTPLRQAEQFFDRYEKTYAVLAAYFRYLGELPLTTQKIQLEDGSEWGYSLAYNNLRRWFELPRNPSRSDFPDTLAGMYAFERAQKDFKRRRSSISREARNVPTQGGNAVIIAEALLLLEKRGRKYGVKSSLAIYDEVLAVMPERNDTNLGNILLEQCMAEPGDKYFTRVECRAEANPPSKYWKKF